jgi:predicted small secreted protein
MKRLMCFVLLFGALGLLAGCNTIEGAGKDIEQGGEAIQKSTK